jgi:hypothetical protein
MASKVQPQHFAPEVYGRADGPWGELVDVFENEVPRLAFTARRLQFRLMGAEKECQPFRLHLLHGPVGQLGEQFSEIQPHRRAGAAHDVPRKIVRIVVAQMDNQRRRWRRLSRVPLCAIPFLVFGAKRERVVVSHYLKAAGA